MDRVDRRTSTSLLVAVVQSQAARVAGKQEVLPAGQRATRTAVIQRAVLAARGKQQFHPQPQVRVVAVDQ